MTDVAELLNQAADLLEEPGAWTQLGGDEDGSDGECARNFMGQPVPSDDPEASCWCLFGAIERVSDGHDTQLVRAFEWLSGKRSHDLVVWNDEEGRTQGEVVAALRAAAEKARTGL